MQVMSIDYRNRVQHTNGPSRYPASDEGCFLGEVFHTCCGPFIPIPATAPPPCSNGSHPSFYLFLLKIFSISVRRAQEHKSNRPPHMAAAGEGDGHCFRYSYPSIPTTRRWSISRVLIRFRFLQHEGIGVTREGFKNKLKYESQLPCSTC